MRIRVGRIVTGPWSENCYVVSDESGKALVIDPGDDPQSILAHIDAGGFDVAGVLNTHAHFDHVGAVAAVKTRYRVPFYLHARDSSLLKHANTYRVLFAGRKPIEIPKVDVLLSASGTIRLGPFDVAAVETPGHTAGGVCYRLDNQLFTGDTLLKGKVGRTDLPGGDAGQLARSLAILSTYPGDTALWPGHGEPTTLGEELKTNGGLPGIAHEHPNR